MKAPSERHLEDWIAAHANVIFGESVHVVRRQFHLPSGIADVLTRHHNYLNVVELKKGAITAECVAQTLRYMGDLYGIYESVIGNLFTELTISRGEFDNAYAQLPRVVEGTIIGSRFEDRHLPVICEAANISLLTYDFNGVDYTFKWYASPVIRSKQKEYDRYFDGELITVIKEQVFRMSENFHEYKAQNYD